MSLSVNDLPPLEQLKAVKAKRHLHEYMRQAWHVVEPGTQFVDGWHLSALAEHLEAVSNRQIRNLLITMPPRHMKSLTVSVFWPTWEWIAHPERRWLFSSYDGKLSIRDSVKCRRVIMSPWYQRHWGHVFRLTDDQNAKMRFENDKTGYRIATSVDGASTGEGGDYVICDDPHNVKEGESEAHRVAALTWWDEVMASRLNDQRTGCRVIVMQRVHEEDLAGHVLEQGGYEHLNLPAEYQPPVYEPGVDLPAPPPKPRTRIGFEDPRTDEGALLWPEHVGHAELDDLKIRLGSYAYAAQYDQQPVPRGGGLFKLDWWRYYDPLTWDRKTASMVIQVWDTAFSEKTSADFSVCATWAQTPAGLFVLDLYKERVEFPDLKRVARALYTQWRPQAVCVENKASGQSLIQELRRPDPVKPKEYPALPIVAIEAAANAGDKLTRATSVTPYVESGMVHLPTGAPWVKGFIDEHARMPKSAHDDQVDTTAMAIKRLLGLGPQKATLKAIPRPVPSPWTSGARRQSWHGP